MDDIRFPGDINLDKELAEALDGRLASLSDFTTNAIMEQAKQMLNSLVDFKEMMMMYTCAMKEIRTKFEVLNTEFNIRYQRNPINSISARLKSATSIMEKLARKNVALTMQNLEEHVQDIAGIRVICSYVDDIYKLADALVSQDDITILSKKDYIKEPKSNGYRSMHLIVSVPVFFSDSKRNIRVEVQIRTIAMDFWASLEHQMKYKKEIGDQEETVRRLTACAEVIAKTDAEMMEIRRHIEESADAPSEAELLMEKLEKFQTPLV